MTQSSTLKNALWLIFDKGGRLVINLLVTGLIARHLGVEAFGEINLYVSILTVLAVVCSLGMNRIIVREVTLNVADKGWCDSFVASLFITRLIFSFIIWFSVTSIYVIFTDKNTEAFLFVTLSLVFMASDVFNYYFQGVSQFRTISIIRFCSFLISSVYKLYCVYAGYSIVWFSIGVVLEHAIVALLFFLVFFKDSGFSFKCFKLSRVCNLMTESWPEIIAGVCAILFMRIELFFLHYYHGDYAVGVYTAATRITEAWYFVPTAIAAAFLPKLTRLKETSQDHYTYNLKELFCLLIYLSVCVASVFTVFSKEIVWYVYGADFISSSNVMIIHAWGSIFLSIGVSSGLWLVTEKKLKLNLMRNVFGLLVCIMLNFILTPHLGPQGAALSTVIGMFSAYYLFDYFHDEAKYMIGIKNQSLSPFIMVKILKKLF